MPIAFISFVVMLLGLLLWVMPPTPPILKEVGHDMFWCGLLVTLATVSGHDFRLST